MQAIVSLFLGGKVTSAPPPAPAERKTTSSEFDDVFKLDDTFWTTSFQEGFIFDVATKDVIVIPLYTQENVKTFLDWQFEHVLNLQLPIMLPLLGVKGTNAYVKNNPEIQFTKDGTPLTPKETEEVLVQRTLLEDILQKQKIPLLGTKVKVYKRPTVISMEGKTYYFSVQVMFHPRVIPEHPYAWLTYNEDEVKAINDNLKKLSSFLSKYQIQSVKSEADQIFVKNQEKPFKRRNVLLYFSELDSLILPKDAANQQYVTDGSGKVVVRQKNVSKPTKPALYCYPIGWTLYNFDNYNFGGEKYVHARTLTWQYLQEALRDHKGAHKTPKTPGHATNLGPETVGRFHSSIAPNDGSLASSSGGKPPKSVSPKSVSPNEPEKGAIVPESLSGDVARHIVFGSPAPAPAPATAPDVTPTAAPEPATVVPVPTFQARPRHGPPPAPALIPAPSPAPVDFDSLKLTLLPLTPIKSPGFLTQVGPPSSSGSNTTETTPTAPE